MQATERSAEPATLAVTGKRSSGEGEWITPSVSYVPEESGVEIDLPKSTNRRSSAFIIQIAETDRVQPPVRPAKPPARLIAVAKFGIIVAVAAFLASVLLVINYDPSPVMREQVMTPQDTARQQREAAFRQERDARLRQEKGVSDSKRR
jgi:hypothetical protein